MSGSSDPIRSAVGVCGVTFGKNVRIVEPCNLYGCVLEDDVFVGPFVEIQQGVRVGKGTRIQSHAFLCEGVTIGEECVISHGAMFINDLFRGGPARGDRSKWKKTHLADRVYVGTNATILPVQVVSDVVIGAGAVVTRNITEPGTYAGNPARKIQTSK
jgi:acetyltransferase-like isoleucine patch superfamily enzyme